ncbi:hypothetical protein NEFER03_1756 [Nematocida sp. LUAm3]|nr:hypothetical protein NEFER03_1756 [Nematocida sp. LUAm3]KAI5173937.1 hypothetical protein NEFER02_0404 [Nematocida sp. LUAm2]KAI5177318.1 hypothetical protein NEFER01_0593 [Nematocida sp. LUAm1]
MTEVEPSIKYSGIDINLIEANDVKRKHVLLREEGNQIRLVEIKDFTKCKTGKHGSAKVTFSANDLKTEKFVTFTHGVKDQVIQCNLLKVPCTFLGLDEAKEELHLLNEETGEDFYISTKRLDDPNLDKIRRLDTLDLAGFARLVLVDTPYYVNIDGITENSE